MQDFAIIRLMEDNTHEVKEEFSSISIATLSTAPNNTVSQNRRRYSMLFDVSNTVRAFTICRNE